VEDARAEAKACIEVLGNRKFSLPIYYDVEEPSILGKGKDFVSECIRMFCDELERAGYFAGFYTSKSVLERLVHDEIRERYACWLAFWSDKDTYEGQHGMWQYSDKGRVNGINGDVDMDEMYVDYSSIIVNGGYNNYPEKPDSSDGADDANGADDLETRLRNIERRLDALEQGRK
jgi:GH25 family lysozyme M1 (1,4-beta-N-acetylmuramidase)